MTIQELKEILQGEVPIFQETCFKSSQINQLTTMYHFEHTSHDVLLNLLFQNLYKLFLHERKLHQ